MSNTETQTPQTGEQPQDVAPHLDLLTDEERAALALELTDADGEGQPAGDDDADENADGAAAGKTTEPAKAQEPEKPAEGDPQAPADAAVPADAAGAAPVGADAAADSAAAHTPGASYPAVGAGAGVAGQASTASAGTSAQPAALESMAAFQYQVPKDYEERVKALEGKFLDLDQKLEGGEIDQGDYNKRLRTLTHEQSELAAIASRAEIAREMAQQAQQQLAQRESAEWGHAVQALAAEIKGQDGIDYANDTKLAQALGKQVEALMVERGLDPAQPVQGKLDLLRQAHRVIVFFKTGKAPGETAVKPDAQAAQAAAAQAIKDAAAARKPDLTKVAKSIASIPAADNGADLGEFAALDKLKGEKLEVALDNLRRTNPAAYERYLSEV